jgi:hypothetical protein
MIELLLLLLYLQTATLTDQEMAALVDEDAPTFVFAANSVPAPKVVVLHSDPTTYEPDTLEIDLRSDDCTFVRVVVRLDGEELLRLECKAEWTISP